MYQLKEKKYLSEQGIENQVKMQKNEIFSPSGDEHDMVTSVKRKLFENEKNVKMKQ